MNGEPVNWSRAVSWGPAHVVPGQATWVGIRGEDGTEELWIVDVDRTTMGMLHPANVERAHEIIDQLNRPGRTREQAMREMGWK